MNILVTGGTGFIGSHTVVELLENNYNVIIVDNLSNSKKSVLDRVEMITNKKPIFYEFDLVDQEKLEDVFRKHKIDSVIHFAGFKAVGESNKKPIEYYENNIGTTLTLINVMRKYNCKNIVFSSSATVYGDSDVVPVNENSPVGDVNCPYGRTKLFIEYILKDLYASDKEWNIAILRYFNPVGAHPSGLIGEDPNGIPNNLVPYITQVAIGKLERLSVFGNDYKTHDGTGVRDYIHVCDLAHGHLCAINKLESKPGLVIYNLGTGEGYSVLDMLHAFEKVVGKEIPYRIAPRREGDIEISFADPKKAFEEMGFKTQKTLDDMCKDQWKWQINSSKF